MTLINALGCGFRNPHGAVSALVHLFWSIFNENSRFILKPVPNCVYAETPQGCQFFRFIVLFSDHA